MLNSTNRSRHTRSSFNSASVQLHRFPFLLLAPSNLASSNFPGRHGSSASVDTSLHTTFDVGQALSHCINTSLIKSVPLITHSISYLPILPYTWYGARGKPQPAGQLCFQASITSRRCHSNIVPFLWQADMEDKYSCFARDV